MEVGTDVHGAQRVNPNDVSGLLAFPLVPPANTFFFTYQEV